MVNESKTTTFVTLYVGLKSLVGLSKTVYYYTLYIAQYTIQYILHYLTNKLYVFPREKIHIVV